jgi:hypothetical protein
MEDEQIKALSRMVGEQNTTIGYQDAMLARLDADLALARAVCDQLQQELREERAHVAALRDRESDRAMKMTDLQFAGISINLATLGQVDLSDNDPAMLHTLAFLLNQALANTRKALAAKDELTTGFDD